MREEYRMKGIILADVNVIRMQDKCMELGKKSKIIDASLKKDGNIRKDWTKTGISEVDFEVVQKHVKQTIKKISKEILKGTIDINPYYNKKQTPCNFCEYKSICRFDPRKSDNNYNIIQNFSNDDVINKMKEEIKE